MKEIKITDINGIRIGNAQDEAGGTGCTVIIAENGAYGGVDIRGGGPASRETPILSPLAATDRVHAVLLSGGSAFGLDAAGGVMEFLEEKGIGFDVGITHVPIVCQSCIFDLVVGDKNCRPTKEMAKKACEDAWQNNDPQQGCAGAGMGATVGKVHGFAGWMKSGMGLYAAEVNGLQVGAVAVVNALGDVFENGKKIAGLTNDSQTAFLDSAEEMYKNISPIKNRFTDNTTICCVVTNAVFDKSSMNKIAAMAHNGMVRAISPVNTGSDGDSVYAVSVGDFKADTDVVGTLAAQVLEKAIINAVKHAKSAYGITAAADLKFNCK